MRSIGAVTILEACDEPSLKHAVATCDALLVRSRAEVTRGVLESATRLRVIGRAGVGLENIDLEAARERGVTVVHTPYAATEAVADLTVGLILDLLRKVTASDTMIRRRRFEEAREQACSREMSELTLGIVGLGRIGRAVARRCYHGFGMRVLYNDLVAPGWLDFVATAVTKDELYAQADVLSLHVPLTDQTRRLMDATALSKVRRGAFLINTSRGGVVDSTALAQALHTGALGGAALDVFEPEPPGVDDPLLLAPHTLFTPHIGARTYRGMERMNAVVEDVLRVLRGQPPHFAA